MANPRTPRVRAKATDLNLTHIMNLIIILIPALLLSAAFVQTAVINVSAPLIAPGIDDSPAEPPDTPPLDLSLAITGQGFQVAGKGLAVHAGDGPTIPKTGEGYDYPALTEHLVGVKDRFPDEASVTIHADADVPYETLVRVMDASREAGGRPLFPEVAVAAGR